MEIESNGLGFCTWKSSLTNLIFVHGNRAQSTRFSSFSTRTWNHQGREDVNELTCSVLLSTKQSMWVEIKDFFLYCTLSNIYKYFFIFISRHARKKFGLFEKHKDYVERAQAFHKMEDTLRVSVLASCLAGNQTLKYIMGFFCKWIFFFFFALQKLMEKVAIRNPDEFYFKMIKTRTVDGVHKLE